MTASHVIPQPDHTELHEQPRFVSVEEYLHTSYDDGDMDYVDGCIEERNFGEWSHADLQSELVHIFRTNRSTWGYRAVVESRLQVASTRFRVPDVMVLRKGQLATPVIREAPLLCIEILSTEDRWSRTERKFADYIRMGIETIWIIDPKTREALHLDKVGTRALTDGILRVPETPIHIDLHEVFANLDAEQS